MDSRVSSTRVLERPTVATPCLLNSVSVELAGVASSGPSLDRCLRIHSFPTLQKATLHRPATHHTANGDRGASHRGRGPGYFRIAGRPISTGEFPGAFVPIISLDRRDYKQLDTNRKSYGQFASVAFDRPTKRVSQRGMRTVKREPNEKANPRACLPRISGRLSTA
jgi:hypothetical protein